MNTSVHVLHTGTFPKGECLRVNGYKRGMDSHSQCNTYTPSLQILHLKSPEQKSNRGNHNVGIIVLQSYITCYHSVRCAITLTRMIGDTNNS